MKKQIFTFLLVIGLPLLIIAQWNDDPSENTQIYEGMGSQVQPKVVVNDEGYSYVSWFSSLDYSSQWNVHMQRLDADGNKLWPDTGILISNHPTNSWTTDYGLALDNEDNAILVTQDERTGASDVYAYKISPSGEFLWGDDGIALTNDPAFNPSPAVVTDEQGNCIIMWSTYNDPGFISTQLQKLLPDGQELWGEVIIVDDTMHCWQPSIISGDDSSVFVVWIETETTDTAIGNWPNMYSYAQKIDANGNFVWPSKVPIDTIVNMPLARFEPSLVNDGNGGLFVGWMAYPMWSQNLNCYVQHIDNNGENLWAPNGVVVSDSLQYHHYGPLMIYQENKLFAFWNEIREWPEPPKGAVFGQKFSEQGDKLWSDQGMPLSEWFEMPDTLFTLSAVRAATNNEFAIFYEYEFLEVLNNTDTLFHDVLKAARIDSEGNYVWDNAIEFANSANGKHFFVASELANDQWICAWADNRNDPNYGILTDIYAQNITLEGNMGPLSITDNKLISSCNVKVYPNPFVHNTTIEYTMQNNGSVKIELLDIHGQHIKTLFDGYKQLGTIQLPMNSLGLRPGVYFVGFTTNGKCSYQKIIISR